MTSFVIRHRDQRRRERMIDEAVRRARIGRPVTWERICAGPDWVTKDNYGGYAFVENVCAEFRRMAAR